MKKNETGRKRLLIGTIVLLVILIATVTTQIHTGRGGAGTEQPTAAPPAGLPPDDWSAASSPEASEAWYNALPARMEAPTVDELADDPEAFYTESYPNTVVFLERGLPRDNKVSKAQRAFSGGPKANPRAFAARHNHPEWGSYLSLKELSQEAWHQDRGLGERISAAIDRGDLRVALNQFAIWSADKFAAEAKKDPPRRHIQEMHLRNLGAVSTAYFLVKSGRITEERPRVPQTVESEDSFMSGYYEGLFDELVGHGKLIKFGTPEDFIWGRKAGQAVAAKALSRPRIDKPNKAEQNDR